MAGGSGPEWEKAFRAAAQLTADEIDRTAFEAVYAEVLGGVMMGEEKPVHVRVAEALGWANLIDATEVRGAWYGARPGDALDALVPVPLYHLDWYATGPLIERFAVDLAPDNGGGWVAAHDGRDPARHGETPLLAVCHFILALAEEPGGIAGRYQGTTK